MALFLLKKRRKTRLEETNMNRNTLAALSLTASLSLPRRRPPLPPEARALLWDEFWRSDALW